GAPAGTESIVDVADGEPERACLLPVDVELVLRFIIETVRPYQADRRVFAGSCQQLAACPHQRLVADVATVLEFEVESGRVAQLERSRRRERHHYRSPELVKALVGARRERKHRVLAARAARPVLETYEYQASVLSVATEAEAIDGEHATDEV